MIPKIIHYCWFGGAEKNLLLKKCIESWKKYCSDYKIIEWNEENFDVRINKFTKEAYEFKKYAFVSDYVRLFVLKKYGGIYVDTDLEITKNIDVFLKHRAFSSFESKDYISTAIMGAEKGHPWISYLLEYYEGRGFVKEDGTLDMTPNTKIITEMTKEKYGLVLNNEKQALEEGLFIYPDYVFCNNVFAKENFSIHHFNGSWIYDRNFYKLEFLKYKKNYNILVKLLENIEDRKRPKMNIEDYEDIYIFGSGNISKYLIRYLDLMTYRLKGIISRENKEIIYGLKGFSIEELGLLNPNDLIIIVPSYDFTNICDEISTRTKAELISIEYFLDIRA